MSKKVMHINRNNRYIRLLLDTGVFAIGNLLVKLIQYFLLPLYTSSMSTEAYGTGELLNNLMELFLPVVTLALYEAVFRFSIDEKIDQDALLYESCTLIVKIFLCLFAVAGVVQFFVRYEYLWILLLSLLLYSFRMVFANFARGRGRTKEFSISGIINALTLALLSAFFVAYLQWGARGYLLAIGGGHLASLLYLLIVIRIPQRLQRRKHDSYLLRTMLTYSVPLIVNNIAWWLTSGSSRYIVLFTYGTAVAGLYTAANKLPAVISAVAQVFQQAWQLNSAREYESSDRGNFYTNIFRIYSIFILCCTSVAICITPILAQFTLKKDFLAAQYYIPAMMLAVGTHCISTYFGSILLALKKSRQAMNGMLIGAVVNVVLGLALVKPFGIWGVLIASVMCYVSILVHRIISVKKEIPIDLDLKEKGFIYTIVCGQASLMGIGNAKCIIIAVVLLVVVLILSGKTAGKMVRHRLQHYRKK